EWIMDSRLSPKLPISCSERRGADQPGGLTLWTLIFALWCWLCFEPSRNSAERVADVVEVSLKHGADPEIWFVIEAKHEAPQYLNGSVVNKEGNHYSSLYLLQSENKAMIRFFSQHGMKVSFRDLIDFYAPPNLAKLRAMVDAKLKSSKETCGEVK